MGEVARLVNHGGKEGLVPKGMKFAIFHLPYSYWSQARRPSGGAAGAPCPA